MADEANMAMLSKLTEEQAKLGNTGAVGLAAVGTAALGLHSSSRQVEVVRHLRPPFYSASTSFPILPAN